MKTLFVTLLFIMLVLTEDLFEKLSKPVEGGDLNFLRALNNYFGCKTWANQQCTECSPQYIFNDNKICSQVPPQCQKFNRAVGICEHCYTGYEIYNGQCILVDLANSIDRGCKSFKNSKCQECSLRWYFNDEKVCVPIDDQCRKWEPSGECKGCYMGYSLTQEGKCEQIQTLTSSSIDKFCAQWDDLKCLKCAERAYFGPIGLCIPVSDYCKTWDSYDGFCLTCYKGYDLIDGECIESMSNTHPPTDLGCRLWDWEEQICLQCSKRWVFNSDGVCIPVSDDCAEYGAFGQCLECYKGYDLEEGLCMFSQSNTMQPSDLGCALWDWDEQICLECSERWTFRLDGICIPVSDQCKEHDVKGDCTSCYRGYQLDEGNCVLAAERDEVRDQGCKIWDWDSNSCVECSFRWYFTDNGCEKVSDDCKDYDKKDGSCTDCYPGYTIKDDKCVEAEADYCAKKINGKCQLCYPGYRVINGECFFANPLCKTITPEGFCETCYETYVLYKRICVPLVKLVNLAAYYADCCPEQLEQLKREARIA